ncbi:PapB/FocB family fimbrial expression transcriptional regulator [Citrobacter sp. VF227]
MRVSLSDYQKPGILIPGKVDKKYFFSLVDVCDISNPRMVCALEQVLVFGKTRREACGQFGVTASYFSIKIRQLQSVSVLLQQMFPCASHQGGCPLHFREEKCECSL